VSELTPADDRFHPPTDAGEMWWSETAWFSFWVPERRLSGSLYPLFRPNLGVCSAGVYLWDDTTDDSWEVPYAKTFWHLPMPAGDLTDLELANGLSYECREPLSRYRLRYADGDEVALDLTFEGLVAAHGVIVSPERGHLDQPGRVSGTLHLAGEEIAVDCLSMRDRSWGVRADVGSMRAGYSYATASASHGFHTMSAFAGDGDVVLAGYLLRDGELADLRGGTRRVVERHRGRPVRVVVEAEDVLGRRVEAEGRCVNRFAFQASPNICAWMSLTSWAFDGLEAWGEDQDVWAPADLRSLRHNG
jgi:hypothetical protein